MTKHFPPEVAAAAIAAGLDLLGENYAQELLAKAEALSGTAARWQYLGKIQTNKVARLAKVVDCFQGVGRLKEAEAIARHRPGAGVMLQVDFTGRDDRGGVAPAEVPALAAQLRDLDLDLRGLMTVAPVESAAARRAFLEVDRLCAELEIPERSMGMTDDLELAVEAGSTMLRVGRALFGPRA